MNDNPISTAQMREGVVEENVYSKYVNEIIHFLPWVALNHPDWLTPYLKEKQTEILEERQGEKKRARQTRVKAAYMDLVKNSNIHAIINLDNWNANGVMDYISRQLNQFNGKVLTESGYNTKKSAIKHLVRCQYGQYWRPDFDDQMKILWKGFIRLSSKDKKKENKKQRKRQRTERRQQQNQQQQDQEEEENTDSDSDSDWDDDREDFRQGKTPMTPELYKKILHWFLEWGTLEGIFAACYVAMSWHLACRTNNTARVRFSHMSWTHFDAMHVRFRHTKTQQFGEAKRQKRACYSNPFDWEIDLPLLLGLYLATAFNSPQQRGNPLFPGGALAQSKRVGDLLTLLLKEHEEEVKSLGYDSLDEIGLHSIRKGVSTYLASLPGGPPPAALMLRGGWSMGKVKDIYFHQTQGGDEFVGRCAAMLNLMNGEFATSPAFFSFTLDPARLKSATEKVFPLFTACDGMDRILNYCLASMIHHKEKILALPSNHAARSIVLYKQEELRNELAPHVRTLTAWDNDLAAKLTGIPPHIKSLVDIAGIKEEQSKIVEQVFKKVMDGLTGYFDEKEIGGGNLTEGRIKSMISSSLEGPMKALGEQISKMGVGATNTATNTTTNTTTTANGTTTTTANNNPPKQTFTPHLHGGKYNKLPKDFQFPKAGVADLWQRWNVGDTERQIPPLKTLIAEDFKFLDRIPKTDAEKQHTGGKHKDKKRPARKTYNEIKFVCKYIEEQGRLKGYDPSNRSIENVNSIYQAVSPLLFDDNNSARETQLKWLTIRTRLRKKLKKEKETRDAAARAASTAAAATAATAPT